MIYQKNEVLAELKDHQSFLLICHTSPDGDAIGSALALAHRLIKLGKKVQVALPSDPPENLRFLPGIDSVLIAPQKPESYDVAVAVDVSSVEMLKEYEKAFFDSPIRLVIDHHKTNPGYGIINMVDGDAPAAAVLIFRLFQEMPGELSPEECVCLYTALATDTGNFIYESTNAETFSIMETLMRNGLPISHYGRLLFCQKEEPFVQLLKEALGTLRISEDGKIAGMSISLEQMHRAKANEGHRNTIVNYAIDIKGVCFAYLANETPDGKTKMSLRSQVPYDVGELAKRFGGGGHAQASGITLDMPIPLAIEFIEKEMRKLIQDVK